MLTEHERKAAEEIADRLWPVGGDPTFPQSREESDGWMRAYEAAMDGIEHVKQGGEPPTDEEIEALGGHVGAHAFAAGADAAGDNDERPIQND